MAGAGMKYERFARTHLDIVGTSGDEVIARCPFHDDNKPSFYFNVKRGLYMCHACHVTGNAKKLAEALNARLTTDVNADALVNTFQSLRESREGVTLRRYHESWLTRFDIEPTDYWTDERGLSEAIVRKFRLGYDPDRHAVTIPIRDVNGHLLGVIHRLLSKRTRFRYVYPKDFKITQHLFAAHLIKKINQPLAIVEGSIDCIAMWDAGIPAVALLSSHISGKQVKILREANVKRVVLMLDNDTAGWDAREHVHEALTGIQVHDGFYRSEWSGNDPASLTVKQRRTMYNEGKRSNPHDRWRNAVG